MEKTSTRFLPTQRILLVVPLYQEKLLLLNARPKIKIREKTNSSGDGRHYRSPGPGRARFAIKILRRQ